MSRKHYEAIAGILAEHKADASLVEDLANCLANENPRFNRSRFIGAATKNLRGFRWSSKTMNWVS